MWLLFTAPAALGGPAVTLDDPADDDRGPGHYVYPSGSRFGRGQLDLRRFEVIDRADHAELRITVAAPPKKPIEAHNAVGGQVDLSNGIYIQNIDVYVDMTPGVGLIEGLPGRRVAFHPEQGWELAVVLTPQPYGLRSVMEDWGLPGTQVYVPTGVIHEGPTFVARVPHARLGGPVRPEWGWAVAISGATWAQNFELTDRLVDDHQLDAYTLPVHTVPQDDAFGGGTVGGVHPQVIDILTPPGVTQKQLLSAHDAAAKRFATVAMVYPHPEKAAAAGHGVTPDRFAGVTPADGSTAAPAARPRVRDVLETTVVIVDPPAGLAAYKLGVVLDADDRPVGKVVVTAIRSEFVTASIVEGLDAIREGMAVRFPQPQE